MSRSGDAVVARRSLGQVFGTTPLLAWGVGAAVVAGYVLFVAYIANSVTTYTQNVMLVMAVFIILAISLDIAAGITGLYSLGHAALFAMGAYVTAVVADQRAWPVFLLLPVSVLSVALLGALVGALSLRFSGLYFAITTFVLSLVSVVIINRLTITGSYAGIAGPDFPEFPDALSGIGAPLVWCGGICVAVAIFVARSLRRSPLYPTLLAVRDAEPLARSAGVPIARTRILAFVISSALAGLAGWLFAFLGVVSPSQFDWTVSVNILVMVIIGGINTNLGPILGAVLINLFNSYVNISPLEQQILFGAVFVVTIVVMPTGLVGLLQRGWQLLPFEGWLARRRGSSGEEQQTGDASLATVGLASAMQRRGVASGVPAISCRRVCFRYTSGVYALQDVDLTIRPGTIHGLIGPNGSGKSTLINVISGHLRAESGSVEILGQPFERRSASDRAGVGLRRTFQSAVLVGELSARATPVIGQYTHIRHLALRAPLWSALPGAGRERRRLDRASGRALRAVGVPPRWDDRIVADAPHGIQQLLQLALADVGEPAILMLDEPVAGLTGEEVEHTAAVLRELRACGVSILIVEHHTRFIFSICDEVTVLSAGRLVTAGTPSEVRAHAAVREVYLGQ